MDDCERKALAEAAIPLEVLCGQIRVKPYKELTDDLQSQLQQSLEIIRGMLFQQWVGETPKLCQVCGTAIIDVFIDGKINFGEYPWGIMCEVCHIEYGCGFGQGKAQMYQKQGDLYMKVAPGQEHGNGTQEGS
jgi:hypothetical protein